MNTELNKPHFCEMNFMLCSLQIKQNILLNMHFSCSYSDTSYSKSIKKNGKSPIFESLPFLCKSTFSECKGVSRANSDRIIYFN